MQEGVEGIGGGEGVGSWKHEEDGGIEEEWVRGEGERGQWPGSCELHIGIPSGKRVRAW